MIQDEPPPGQPFAANGPWISLGDAAVAAVDACARAFQTDGAVRPDDAHTLPHDFDIPEYE